MWIRFSGPVPTVKPVVGTTLGRFQGVIGLSDAFAIDPDHPITKLDPARPKHWLIARLLAHGVCDERIAQHVDISEFTVKQYARNPQTQAMIEHLDQIKAEIDMLNEERFDDLQRKAIEEMEKALHDEALSTEAKLRLCTQILDRHPKGKFVKSQKNKVESGPAATTELINDLKRRSHMAAAEVIDITPSPTATPQSVPPAQAPDSAPALSLPESGAAPFEEVPV